MKNSKYFSLFFCLRVLLFSIFTTFIPLIMEYFNIISHLMYICLSLSLSAYLPPSLIHKLTGRRGAKQVINETNWQKCNSMCCSNGFCCGPVFPPIIFEMQQINFCREQKTSSTTSNMYEADARCTLRPMNTNCKHKCLASIEHKMFTVLQWCRINTNNF